MTAKVTRKRKPVSTKKAVKSVEKPQEVSEVRETKGRLSMRKKLLIIGIVLVGAYVVFSAKELLIAATVNGYPISRVSVVRELEKKSGKDVLENMITELLITQEAKKANITVSSDELNAKIEDIKTQVKSQGQDLDTLLSAQGMTQEEFSKQIKIQIYVEKLLGDKVTVNDEDIEKFIETNKAYLPEGKSEDELKEIAKKELIQQGLSTKFSEWLTEVKTNAKINHFVDY